MKSLVFLMSAALACGLAAHGFYASPVVQPASASASPEKNPVAPINKPDQFAWQLFVYVNAPGPYQDTVMVGGKEVSTNNALWETWASDVDTFPAAPDPNNPPKWPDKTRPRNMVLRKRALAKGTKPELVENPIDLENPEEVYRNKPAFDYIVQNDLYYTQGLARAFSKRLNVSFPTDAVEVKANWIKIKPEDKNKYHWNYDNKGQLYGMVAMHISSKVLPNWFWATFEWTGNPGRSDYIGSRDKFGVVYPTQGTPWLQRPNPNTLNTIYPPGEVSKDLLKLFDDANLQGGKDPWLNYRLKGSQVDFADTTGLPILLGNSVTEQGFVPSSSCMTCHSRAAVDAQGRDSFGTGFKPSLPGDAQQSYNGYPDPNWFWRIGESPAPSLTNLQVDFVWAIPLRARPAKAP